MGDHKQTDAIRHALDYLVTAVRSGAGPGALVDDYIADFYRPRPLLDEALDALDAQPPRGAGQALEQVAYLLFRGLAGVSSLKSFQSSGPQYDLLVSGESLLWATTCWYIGLPPERHKIVVEAKAWDDRVDHRELARLAAIMQHELADRAGLGVLITLQGATGFPTRERRVKGLVLNDNYISPAATTTSPRSTAP